MADEGAEKYFEQCPSLRSRLSQGGYTTKASELYKDIFDTDTLSKLFAETLFFEMGIQLGTDDVLDAAPPVLPRSAWKPVQATTQTPLVSTLHQSNDDRSFTSMIDESLANTLSYFRTKMITVVSTMLEVSKQERQEERKEYAESRRIKNKQQEAAEKKREEQRKDQEIKRVTERRNDIQQMEKLEKRKEEQRVEEQGKREAQRILDQRAHDLLLMNMMKNML